MDGISHFLEQRLKDEVELTFLHREGSLGTQGEFWSHETMGLGHEDIKEVLLGAPYTGQFQSVPVVQQQKDVVSVQNKRHEGEVQRLGDEDVVLKVEVELLQLQKENAELKAKLLDNAMLKAEVERLQWDNAELNAKLTVSCEPTNP
ncbi:hypothetical protein EJB05_45771 [Eragrostis curvula]|uniref:Uncharacterized protein n=1 Tax=Eragrostis curvula TaxID=38414 RepID=A0A5J9TLG0_9POAL|nr:hypothetical protein EJB05_45771 [Eragrostis curvula]